MRIDILTHIDGIGFDEAWPSRLSTSVGGVAASVLSREHLIRNERASGRLQDLADIERFVRRRDLGRAARLHLRVEPLERRALALPLQGPELSACGGASPV